MIENSWLQLYNARDLQENLTSQLELKGFSNIWIDCEQGVYLVGCLFFWFCFVFNFKCQVLSRQQAFKKTFLFTILRITNTLPIGLFTHFRFWPCVQDCKRFLKNWFLWLSHYPGFHEHVCSGAPFCWADQWYSDENMMFDSLVIWTNQLSFD